MINHVRTLLFGRRDFDAALPGHAMIDPTFMPFPPAGELQKADVALFGDGADNFARNYWLSHFMRLLHAVEQNDATLAYDPRVTYLPLGQELFDLFAGPNPLAVGGTPVFFVGSHRDAVEGRLYRRWDAIATGSNTLQLSTGTVQSSTNLTWSQGLSQLVTLPDSTLQIRIGGGALTSGTQFRIELYRRPDYALEDLPARIETRLTPDEVFRIFAGSPGAFEVWLSEQQLTTRLCGFLHAYAARLDRHRGGT